MDPIVHWRCLALGRVQGVNYRARVAESARRHGVVGWVANRNDGSVVIDVQGPRRLVESFLGDISGPRGASDAHAVRRTDEFAPSNGPQDFRIVRE